MEKVLSRKNSNTSAGGSSTGSQKAIQFNM